MTSPELLTLASVLLWAGLLLVIGLLFGAGDPVETLGDAWRRHRRRRRRLARWRRRARVRTTSARVYELEQARRRAAERAS